MSANKFVVSVLPIIEAVVIFFVFLFSFIYRKNLRDMKTNEGTPSIN